MSDYTSLVRGALEQANHAVDLASTYHEDGAFASAARHLRRAASHLEAAAMLRWEGARSDAATMLPPLDMNLPAWKSVTKGADLETLTVMGLVYAHQETQTGHRFTVAGLELYDGDDVETGYKRVEADISRRLREVLA